MFAVISVYHFLPRHAAETWTILAADMKILDAFHFRCQHKMLWITWQDTC